MLSRDNDELKAEKKGSSTRSRHRDATIFLPRTDFWTRCIDAHKTCLLIAPRRSSIHQRNAIEDPVCNTLGSTFTESRAMQSDGAALRQSSPAVRKSRGRENGIWPHILHHLASKRWRRFFDDFPPHPRRIPKFQHKHGLRYFAVPSCGKHMASLESTRLPQVGTNHIRAPSTSSFHGANKPTFSAYRNAISDYQVMRDMRGYL